MFGRYRVLIYQLVRGNWYSRIHDHWRVDVFYSC